MCGKLDGFRDFAEVHRLVRIKTTAKRNTFNQAVKT
ncbi:hypothetical protein EDF68_102529 [Ochrobactrum sp. BH3]|nr:hypothetical protein EDF68_102529 [Ochrobactrum sp. BH3]